MTWLRNWMLGEQASTLAPGVDNLFMFISAVNTFFFVLICLCIVIFVRSYRRRSKNDVTPHITHNQTLEIVWSVVPLIILIGIFFWGFHGYVTAQIAPANSIEIQVTGKKWVWQFEYPDGMRTLNSFHVPVNRPVRLVMNSEDVLHSFFIPAFRIKKDVLPVRYTEEWFEATKPGVYPIFCTEYCGKGHSDMLARVFVDDPAQYEKWVREGDEEIQKLPLKELGAMVHENRGCATCHSLDGTRGQGPSWKGIFGTTRQFADGTSAVADENYIRQSILEPQAHVVQGYEPIMPTYKGLLRDREILGAI
ncbi:MAG TPA: cytochrome c oxidase subunit II, partial [Bryobacteraceae bacterium]|nr:cytochrome c oxidase subunit II [Bryobacteraceae bacterium]